MITTHVRASLAFLSVVFAAGLGLSVLLKAPPASAEVGIIPSTTSAGVGYCTHTIVQADLPYAINTSGVYCLAGDLTVPNTATFGITISNSTVVLDLGGYTLNCNSAMGVGGVKVLSGVNHVIRNGTIEACADGIFLNGGGHIIVEKMLLQGLQMGVDIATAGTVVVQDSHFQSFNFGIYDTSSGNIFVKDNTMEGCVGGSSGAMIDFQNLTGKAIVERNEMISSVVGIRCHNTQKVILTRYNSFVGVNTPYANAFGDENALENTSL